MPSTRRDHLSALAAIAAGQSLLAEAVGGLRPTMRASVFKGTIGNYLKQNGVGLTKYVRIEVGQG